MTFSRDVQVLTRDSLMGMLKLSSARLAVTDTQKCRQKKAVVVPGLSGWFICFQLKKPADQAIYPR